METLKEIQITAKVEAVIPVGNFENYRPAYSVTEVHNIACDEESKEGFSKKEKLKALKRMLDKQLFEDYERIKIERIERTKKNVRFYDIDNRKYPSVTSILGWEGIAYPEEKLEQYAARGTVVHKLIDEYFKGGCKEWKDPADIPSLKPELIILKEGDLGLTWEDCGYKEFFEKHDADIVEPRTELKVVNNELFYAGTTDMVCMWKGELAIVDFKTASNYPKDRVDKFYRQLAAYANCLKGIKQMIIVPLNPGNKTGYGKPMISDRIDHYFKAFLEDRKTFKRIFGI